MDGSSEHSTRSFAETVRSYSWLRKIRPLALRTLAARVVAPVDRRRIVRVQDDLLLYLDPLSHLGWILGSKGSFEPATVAVFRREIESGHNVLDIGANEGFFTALAGVLVGGRGFVAAVEPQQRLCDLIRINLQLNNSGTNYLVFNAALGEREGTRGELNLYPFLHSGASSFVRRARFMRAVERVTFIDPESIFRDCGVDKFHFVKVDTEGFEHKIIETLLPAIEAGRIVKLFVDYHEPILRKVGVDPRAIHARLVERGMSPRDGDPSRFSGYVLYDYVAAQQRSADTS